MKKILIFIFSVYTTSLISQDYYIYVAAESEDEVSLIKFDGTQAYEKEKIKVGIMKTEIEGPHGITVDPNGEYWYLSLAHGNPYGSLVKYSTESNKPISKTKLGLFPASMQISPVTGLLYCVNFNLHGDMKPSSVSVVDPDTMTEIKKITTGSMPHGSRISPNGLFQYSVAMMSGELFEIDALSLKVNRVLNLEPNIHIEDSHESIMMHSTVKPTWVIHHPSKHFVYVAGNGSDEIIKVDLKKWEITQRVKTGKGPYNLEVSQDGKYLLASIKGEGKTGVWKLKDLSFVKNIENSGSVSHGVTISPDSKYAFVSLEGVGGEPGIVDVISLKNLKVISSVKIGKQAGGIAFWKTED